jgi:hypothetical protein
MVVLCFLEHGGAQILSKWRLGIGDDDSFSSLRKILNAICNCKISDPFLPFVMVLIISQGSFSKHNFG